MQFWDDSYVYVTMDIAPGESTRKYKTSEATHQAGTTYPKADATRSKAARPWHVQVLPALVCWNDKFVGTKTIYGVGKLTTILYVDQMHIKAHAQAHVKHTQAGAVMVFGV